MKEEVKAKYFPVIHQENDSKSAYSIVKQQYWTATINSTHHELQKQTKTFAEAINLLGVNLFSQLSIILILNVIQIFPKSFGELMLHSENESSLFVCKQIKERIDEDLNLM